MTSANIDTVRVDYSNPSHCRDLCRLLVEYARYETDDAESIADDAFDDLPERLSNFPTAFSILAYRGQKAVGLTNCFFGFSTFNKRRLVNIHDVMVTESERGKGVASFLLAKVEEIARENDCCRLTLEVLDDNARARRAYEKEGFGRTPYHPDNETLFLQKKLGA